MFRNYLLLFVLFIISVSARAQHAATVTDSAALFREKALACSRAGKPDSGIYYSMKVLPIFEQRQDLRQLCETEWILAGTYNMLKQYERSSVYCERGIEHAGACGDSLHLALLLLTKSANLTHPNQGHAPKEVLQLNKDAFRIFQLLKDTVRMAHALSNIGVYFAEAKDEKNFDSAIFYYNQSNEINLQYGRFQNAGVVYDNIARLLILQKRYREAIPYEMKAMDISGRTRDFEMLKKNYRKLITIYDYLDQTDSTEYYVGKYAAAVDSFFSGRLTSALSDAEAKYETQKKQNRIDALTKDNLIQLLKIRNQDLEIDTKEYLIRDQQLMLLNDSLQLANQTEYLQIQEQTNTLQQEQLRRLKQEAMIRDLELSNRKLEVNRKNLVIGLMSLSLFALGATAYLYYRWLRRRKETQLQDAIAAEQKRATSALFEGEQKERIRIARDLHDSIGQLLSAVKMQLSAIPSGKEHYRTSLLLLDKTISEVRSISHNLIPEELSFGLIKAVQELCSQLEEAGQLSVVFSYSHGQLKMDGHKHAALSLYRIIQEVTGNMIRHAAASELKLSITETADETTVIISDNGKGFDIASLQHTSGIGWKNIRARVSLLNGNFTLQSGPAGTLVNIHIPHE
ncbi:sensor histidine kinase [Rurimicrobium arvi]|uniref:histidine kinase n=1 Tax=Rurimicrobium arvi TaxID=2049916 RepID=A0ABP8MDH8_9BACT